MLMLSKHKALVIALLGVPVLAVALLTTQSKRVSASVDAAATYKSKCASCHGADGSGNTPAGKGLKVADLRAAAQKESDDTLYNVIAKGKGKMPAYEKTLGADACKALVSYIRQLK